MTCLVDDFAVESDELWLTLGADLLNAVFAEARAKGAVQGSVICPVPYDERAALLSKTGLAATTNWWIGDLV